MTVQLFQAKTPISDEKGNPTNAFIAWARGVVSALNNTSDTANAAVPSSRNVVASGGIQGGGSLSDEVGVTLYRARSSVATLPTTGNGVGDWAYAVDGRKPGESAGSGTGVPVYWSVTAWISIHSGAAITA